ncbi:hypothetical protein K9517_001409 [Vibrio vulnificus]|nr:hypothetical protein [Vibrio vulnificus]EIC2758849.1 hypothetical protein [Vibrio vulnificus]
MKDESAVKSTQEKEQLNGDLVKQFVDAQIYLVIKKNSTKTPARNGNVHHHVCGFD